MLIKIKKASDARSSEITPKELYMSRRNFLGTAAAGVALAPLLASTPAGASVKLEGVVKSAFRTDEEQTPHGDITSYNNFYEFTIDKDVYRHVGDFESRPWTMEVTGLVQNPQVYDVDELTRLMPLEERLYRHRCVEAWSMAFPWTGFPMKALMDLVQPQSSARYVKMTSFLRPDQAKG